MAVSKEREKKKFFFFFDTLSFSGMNVKLCWQTVQSQDMKKTNFMNPIIITG